MNTTRITSTVGAGVVAGIAAWSSWSHMVHVALRYGERPEVAYVLPLSVDGLLVVASVAMVDDKHSGRRPRMSAKVAFAVGVAASLGANIDGAHPNWGARLVAGWPAIALLLVVELLSRRGKRVAEDDASDDVADVTGDAPVTTTVTAPAPRNTSNAGTTPASRRGKPRTADRVARAAARTPQATPVQIAARLKLSERTVQRHLLKPLTFADPALVGAVNGAQLDDE